MAVCRDVCGNLSCCVCAILIWNARVPFDLDVLLPIAGVHRF